MEQKFDGPPPQAQIRLDGRKVIRSEITGDWGLRVQWHISRDGQVVATPAARAEDFYELTDETPGNYEIVLQMWHYIDYRKNNETREYLNSKYIDISNKVSLQVAAAPAAEAAAAETKPADAAAVATP